MDIRFTESDLIKSIALAFCRCSALFAIPVLKKPLRERMQGRFSSCVALTTTDLCMVSWRINSTKLPDK